MNRSHTKVKVKMKRLLSILLCLAILFSYGFQSLLTVSAVDGVWEGEGTEANPYLIENLADLEKLSAGVNGGADYNGKYFRMTADIDMSVQYSENTGRSWIPIGGMTNMEEKNCHNFRGVFDGNGHVVRNIYVDMKEQYCVGLFGHIESEAVIKNLGVEGGSVTGKNRVGSIAGNSCGAIINCYNTSNVAAVVNRAGGIVGSNTNGRVENCYNTGVVKGQAAVGAINNYEGTITNCYYLDTCMAKGRGIEITAGQAVDESKFSGFDFTGIWMLSPILLRPVLRSVPEAGDGSKEHPFLISNLANLEAFQAYINSKESSEEYFELKADIDMSAKYSETIDLSWTPIGSAEAPFDGFFDGNGYKIHNLYIKGSNENQGLFGYNKGFIANLGIEGGSVAGTGNVGAITGTNMGEIIYCYSTGSVRADSHSGGIAGNNGGEINNCFSTGNVTGTMSFGGITGENSNSGKADNCYYNNSVNTSPGEIPGITGKAAEAFTSGEITYLLNGGSLMSADDALTDGTQMWYQTLQTDAYPQLSGGTVYGIKTYPCLHNAEIPTSIVFSNTDGMDIYQYDYLYVVDSANEAQIIESCLGCAHNESATIMATDSVYDGSEKKMAQIVYSDNWKGDRDAQIVYDGDLVNVGEVTAKTTINEKTASVTFEIMSATQESPVVSGVKEEISGQENGKITGVTSGMEYRADTDMEYTPISGEEVTGLKAGVYYVRYKASANYAASGHTKVIIDKGVMLTVTVPVTQTGYLLTSKDSELNWMGSTKLTFILADGYSKVDGEFIVKATNAVLTDNNNGTYTISGATGNVVVSVEGVLDKTPPKATITLKDNWNKLWNGITFDKFFNETQTFTITVEDANTGSGLDKIFYYLSETEVEDVTAITGWTEYTGPVKVNPDKVFVIYAKITDKAGNITYINSDGITLDATLPVITEVEDGGIYYGDVTFKVNDANFAGVTVDGEAAELTEGAYTIMADSKEHSIIATDKAGNITEYKITVYKIGTESNQAHSAASKSDSQQKTIPQTGDNSMLPWWFWCLLVSALCIVVLSVVNRKKNNRVD